MTSELTKALAELREDDVHVLVDRLISSGTDPVEILEACRRGMDEIGKKFACGEAFVPELVMAGEVMQSVTEQLMPLLGDTRRSESLGTIVIGTVMGDIHDIGKDIVASMLEIGGFDVVDLGVDVSPQKFVESARTNGARLVALSCLLTTAFTAMKETVEAVRAAGLDGTKVLIGGAPVTSSICEYTGADGWGDDAVAAVELAKQWTGSQSNVG